MEKEARKDWAEVIRECSESNLAKTEWCRRHGIVPKTFFYHQRKIRDGMDGANDDDSARQGHTSAASAVMLAELPLAARRTEGGGTFVPAAVVRIADAEIAIGGSISAELLSAILKGIRHAQ